MHEHQIRRDLIKFSHLCYERRLLVAMDGNLSALLPSGNVLCTRAGCHKGFLTDDDLMVIDRRGNVIRGTGKPTSEMAMHLACYDARPDIAAVVHAHPPISIAFTIANKSLARCVLPEVVLTLGVVPTIDYQTTGTSALADKVGSAIQNHDAVLLDRHGAVCVGQNLLEAFCRLETMEHTALITKMAHDLGGIKELPAEESIKLRSMGLKRYGGPPSAVAKADEPCVDLPEACTQCAIPSEQEPPSKPDLTTARPSANAQQPHRSVESATSVLEDVVMAEVLKALAKT